MLIVNWHVLHVSFVTFVTITFSIHFGNNIRVDAAIQNRVMSHVGACRNLYKNDVIFILISEILAFVNYIL